ncbi:DNA-binding winged helix-turn-helix (wHTH) protein/tetratricopeptide (TPR) repeat protein [Kaistia hirudinis]|uniref:DNA-binding winged helix-turn-helix (WHTH) protein/tetratricopeptide (TPR) repeat protein n=1 Tax=Kaistia hirudinis TaxID=1293440 RepID=A0A840AR34_9HYPH|nr:helix-turn-helix domain-containing protein [Kaistia hirudinis]MBB3932810.1 DNA-binding winged helix-turn-helix (wHTH) protein/tetratricopeptide (TPR) repeat protein [Kaistia hirudinis]
MMEVLRYRGIVFDGSLLSARLDDQTEIRFTRSERALLAQFTRHPGVMLSRNQLLDAIDGEGSDSSDRRVDFIINRLRAKLGDPARSPRLIETRYGEGYVWIADRVRAEIPAGTLLVIGPVHGVPAGAASSFVQGFLAALDRAFRAQAAPGEPVLLLPDWKPGAPSSAPRFSIEISFGLRGGVWHGAALLREGVRRDILVAERLDFADQTAAHAEAERLAGLCRATMWRHMAHSTAQSAVTPTEQPLYVRLYDASRRFALADQSWIEMEAQLRAAGADRSDEPEAALMWGCHLYARLLFEGGAGGLSASDRAAISDEIERRAIASLPHCAGRPLLVLAAAKLLFFVDRGYDALAEELAEQAFAQSTALAASFAMIGQIRLFRGEPQEAIELFDRGIALTERGSEFHLYLLTFRLTAELAGGDRAASAASFAELCALNPRSLFDVGPFIAEARDDGMNPAVQALFDQFDLARTRGAVAYLHFVMGRHFRVEAQRERILAGIVYHARRRFGADAIPEEVRQAVPGLVA